MLRKLKEREHKRKIENLIKLPGKNKEGKGNPLRRKSEGDSVRIEVILRASQKEITEIPEKHIGGMMYQNTITEMSPMAETVTIVARIGTMKEVRI